MQTSLPEAALGEIRISNCQLLDKKKARLFLPRTCCSSSSSVDWRDAHRQFIIISLFVAPAAAADGLPFSCVENNQNVYRSSSFWVPKYPTGFLLSSLLVCCRDFFGLKLCVALIDELIFWLLFLLIYFDQRRTSSSSFLFFSFLSLGCWGERWERKT